jgi:hypothetical protein
MFFLLRSSLVFRPSLNSSQKKNLCFPITHDFHIHWKIEEASLIPIIYKYPIWQKYSSEFQMYVHLSFSPVDAWILLSIICSSSNCPEAQWIEAARSAFQFALFWKLSERCSCLGQKKTIEGIFIVVLPSPRYLSRSIRYLLPLLNMKPSWRNGQTNLLYLSTRMSPLSSYDEGSACCRKLSRLVEPKEDLSY